MRGCGRAVGWAIGRSGGRGVGWSTNFCSPPLPVIPHMVGSQTLNIFIICSFDLKYFPLIKGRLRVEAPYRSQEGGGEP